MSLQEQYEAFRREEQYWTVYADDSGMEIGRASHEEPSERICKECWGLGGAEIRGGQGQCERCGRSGVAAVTQHDT